MKTTPTQAIDRYIEAQGNRRVTDKGILAAVRQSERQNALRTSAIREGDRYLRYQTWANLALANIRDARSGDDVSYLKLQGTRLRKSIDGMERAFFALRDYALALEAERRSLRRALRRGARSDRLANEEVTQR